MIYMIHSSPFFKERLKDPLSLDSKGGSGLKITSMCLGYLKYRYLNLKMYLRLFV